MKLITCIVLVAVIAISALIVVGATAPTQAQTSGQACYNKCQREYDECKRYTEPWRCYDYFKACFSRCKF